MSTMRALILSALVAAGGLGLFGAPKGALEAVAASGTSPAVFAQAPMPAKDPVKQLRGKLLYERSRLRKLEREAVEANAELAKRIQAMDAEREALYVKHQPKLAEHYAREKELLKQIEAMTRRK